MKENINKLMPYITGAIGAALLFFVGWEHNITVAAWISFPILIYSFRRIDKWYKTLPLVLIMAAARFLVINGAWDLEPVLLLVFPFLVTLPLLISLYLDRAYYKKMNLLISTFVFPCTFVVFDYILTYANLGMTFSVAYTQSKFLPLIQATSLFGSWFIEFIVVWFAPVAVLAAQNIRNLSAVAKPLIAYAVVFAIIMSFGYLRLSFDRPDSKTVRIASITEPHDRDYWAITDAGTPRQEANSIKPSMARIQQKLFESSKRAADYGAKIIFWSEGNCPVYEDDFDAFLSRAKNFASENHVYFMPTVVKLIYNQTRNGNLAIMINPDGNVEFQYEKTVSWYPTESDGVIHVIDTPYGKISTAICFDMDYPALISQARDADIMLVPGFDTKRIDDYHTQVAFLRGVENGFSTVRQANKGSSISADYLGNMLTYQNYFRTDDRVMISDVPEKGKTTLYGLTGEVFLWLDCAAFLAVNIIYILNSLKSRSKKSM